MANFKISQLEQAGNLKGSSYIMVVQDGKNVRATVSQLATGGIDVSEIQTTVDANKTVIEQIQQQISEMNVINKTFTDASAEDILEFINGEDSLGKTITVSRPTDLGDTNVYNDILEAGTTYQVVEKVIEGETIRTLEIVELAPDPIPQETLDDAFASLGW